MELQEPCKLGWKCVEIRRNNVQGLDGKMAHTGAHMFFLCKHPNKTNKTRPVGTKLSELVVPKVTMEKMRRCSHKFCNRESKLIICLSTAQRKKTTKELLQRLSKANSSRPILDSFIHMIYIYIYHMIHL